MLLKKEITQVQLLKQYQYHPSIDENNDQPHLASIPAQTQIKSLQLQLVSHMQYKTHTTANNEYRKQNKHMKVSKTKKSLHKFNY